MTAILFDTPCIASISVGGGAPGLRDAALLEPGMTVERIDAVVLSGGSAFGPDSMGGVQAFLREHGRGFQIGNVVVPIVPGAILFDLLNGGDKDWGPAPVYWHLGYQAAATAGLEVKLGTAGAGYGATTALWKGGLGSASAKTAAGFTVGAIVAVNALGSATIGDGPHFWAAPYELAGQNRGRGWPMPFPTNAMDLRVKGTRPENTTIALVATDAALTKAEAKRIATMAQDGLARGASPGPCRVGWRYGFRRRHRPRFPASDCGGPPGNWRALGRLPCQGRGSCDFRGGGLAFSRRYAGLAEPLCVTLRRKGGRRSAL